MRFSDPISVLNAVFTKASAPKITGSMIYGITLKATVKSWNPGAEYSYQWMRDGKVVDMSGTLTYTVGLLDVGSKLTFRQCASQEHFDSLCMDTPLSQAVQPAVFPTSLKVSIAGSAPKVGAVLDLKITGAPADIQTRVQWLRNGEPIPGASGPSYQTGNSDKNNTIGVSITFSKIGFLSITKSATFKKIM
jgi:hypothetical protein